MSLQGVKAEVDFDHSIEVLMEASHIICQREQYKKNVANCDLAVQDILHDIELSNLNCVGLIKDTKLLKQYLQERRKNKNLLHIANQIADQGIQHAKNAIQGRLDENMYYRPRIVTGLAVEDINTKIRERVDRKQQEIQEKFVPPEPGSVLDQNLLAAAQNKKRKRRNPKKFKWK